MLEQGVLNVPIMRYGHNMQHLGRHPLLPGCADRLGDSHPLSRSSADHGPNYTPNLSIHSIPLGVSYLHWLELG
jgi:hypothetical protein